MFQTVDNRPPAATRVLVYGDTPAGAKDHGSAGAGV